jgi:hypothetical protein
MFAEAPLALLRVLEDRYDIRDSFPFREFSEEENGEQPSQKQSKAVMR